MPTPKMPPIHCVVAFSSKLCLLRGSVDQTENVVENEIAAGAIRLELEALGVVHWLLLLIDLFRIALSEIPRP